MAARRREQLYGNSLHHLSKIDAAGALPIRLHLRDHRREDDVSNQREAAFVYIALDDEAGRGVGGGVPPQRVEHRPEAAHLLGAAHTHFDTRLDGVDVDGVGG